MAINPNVDFTTGQTLLASQQNRFPRGIMAYNDVAISDGTVTAEEVMITGSSFTAVANRYYRVTYQEPSLASAGANAVFTMRIRLTNLAGAIQNEVRELNQSASIAIPTSGICQAIVTLTAGTRNFVATLQCSSGTGQAQRSGTILGFLLVEDIGPA
jgi:hypothetical protein